MKLPAWFSAYLARYSKTVAIALCLGLAASGCAALLMFTSGYLISATAQDGIVLFSILLPIAFVQVFGIGRPAARYVERLVSHDWVLRVTSHLRLDLFWGIERRIDDPARRRATGEYLDVLSDDVAHLQNLYLRVVFPSAVALLLAIGAACAFGFFSVPFALGMLAVFAGTAVALPAATLALTRAKSETVRSLRAEEVAALTDDVTGAADWMLAGRGAQAVTRHAQAVGRIQGLEARIRMVERVCSLASTLVMGAAVCLSLAWAAGRFGGNPATANWIAAFALGFFPLIEAFAVLPAATAQVPAHAFAIARLDGYVGSAGNVPTEGKGAMDASSEAASAEAAAGMEQGAGTSVPPREDIGAVPQSVDPMMEQGAGTSDRPKTPLPNPEAGCEPAGPAEEAIAVEHVTYAYPGAVRPSLSDITLSVPAGERIAILGPSGSGKSTLAEIVRGVLHPDSGAVSVFGKPATAAAAPRQAADEPARETSSHDASAMTDTSKEESPMTDTSQEEPAMANGPQAAPIAAGAPQAASQLAIGYLGQIPYLFNRTLRENLTLGLPGGAAEADDARLVEILSAVGLGPRFEALERGLDTVIGETGSGFSGGEAHRIALARALAVDAPIVLVDEPFAALDPETERALLDTLFETCRDKTLVVVTHHLAEIERFDRVVFMEAGRIALDGSPAQLKESSDRFRTLLAFDRATC